jgi:hypothetical protein
MISDDEDDIVRRVGEVDSDLALDVAHALGERSREVARLIAERDEARAGMDELAKVNVKFLDRAEKAEQERDALLRELGRLA